MEIANIIDQLPGLTLYQRLEIGFLLESNKIKGPKELANKLVSQGIFERGDNRITNLIKIINRSIRLKDDAIKGDPQLEELGFYWETQINNFMGTPGIDRITAIKRLLDERQYPSTFNQKVTVTIPRADPAMWRRIKVVPFFSTFREPDVPLFKVPTNDTSSHQDWLDDDLPSLIDNEVD